MTILYAACSADDHTWTSYVEEDGGKCMASIQESRRKTQFQSHCVQIRNRFVQFERLLAGDALPRKSKLTRIRAYFGRQENKN